MESAGTGTKYSAKLDEGKRKRAKANSEWEGYSVTYIRASVADQHTNKEAKINDLRQKLEEEFAQQALNIQTKRKDMPDEYLSGGFCR
ncbi:hypothetical protein X798_07638 [Onchocerca flexuosa]|uniref:BUD13 homolog n=1 Tax=Onchocerca flexuosa TaxID=387005 RepID=A0A238BIU5_9BILA|nr:hypothetical protein X798_07638 [Onchocerca flexuosa]